MLQAQTEVRISSAVMALPGFDTALDALVTEILRVRLSVLAVVRFCPAYHAKKGVSAMALLAFPKTSIVSAGADHCKIP